MTLPCDLELVDVETRMIGGFVDFLEDAHSEP